jgi:uncharacterized protein (TIRG00374 family)
MKLKFSAHHLIWLTLPLALWLAVRNVPLAEVSATLASINPVWIGLLALVNLAILLLFSSRWYLLTLAGGERVPYLALAAYRLVGFSISYLTPGTQFGGEPAQVYLASSRHGLPAAKAAAALALDRLFEILANFTFLAAGLTLAFNGGLLGALAHPAVLGGVLALVSLPPAYLIAIRFGARPIDWLLGRLPGRIRAFSVMSRAGTLAGSIEVEIAELMRRKPLAVIGALLLSGLVWAALLGEYWLMAYTFKVVLSPLQLILALTAARLAFLTPLPGGIGALEAGQVLAMQALGYPAAVGVGLSLLIRARDLTFGAAGLWLLGVYTRQSQPPAPVQVEVGN